MRTLFMGTTPFSCVILQQLLDDNYDIVGVVTQPDRPFGRKKELKPSPVKVMALHHNIPVYQPEKIRDDFKMILDLNAELIITCAYGQIVPKIILDAPKYGCLNVHASLLPKFRGGAPIHWSIIRGEKETGVTLMHMDVGMDSGDMIAKRSVSIEHDDVMGDVESKLMEASKVLIHEDLKAFLEGSITSQKQNEDDVTYAYTIKKEDEIINFNQVASNVYNHIRGLIPWPVGYGILDAKRVKFHGGKLIDTSRIGTPGTILDVSQHGVLVQCNPGTVLITTLQPEGKSPIKAEDFHNGIGKSWKGKVFE